MEVPPPTASTARLQDGRSKRQGGYKMRRFLSFPSLAPPLFPALASGDSGSKVHNGAMLAYLFGIEGRCGE